MGPNRIPSYQEYVNFVQQMGGSPGYMSPYAPVQAAQPAPMQNNVLPPQQVLQANGKASIDALRMSPNSSVLVMDTTAPIVWLCTSDGLGTVSAAAYDITAHKDAPPVDTASIETRLADVENQMKEMNTRWEALYGYTKPNAGNVKSKQNVRPSGESRAD